MTAWIVAKSPQHRVMAVSGLRGELLWQRTLPSLAIQGPAELGAGVPPS